MACYCLTYIGYGTLEKAPVNDQTQMQEHVFKQTVTASFHFSFNSPLTIILPFTATYPVKFKGIFI